MKTKRQIAKEETREMILEKTQEFILMNGIVNSSTMAISKYCGVGHGTLFMHFQNREGLISEVLKKELLEIAKKLYKIKESENSFQTLLPEYLNLLEDKEDFLVIINKEFSFLHPDVQREVITTEGIVKKLFYDLIQKGIDKNEFKKVNVKMAISSIFGTINYYLERKEYFVSEGSVIRKKKKDIENYFIEILKL